MKLLFFMAVSVHAAYAVATDCSISLNITSNGQNTTYGCCGTGPFLFLYRNGVLLNRVFTKPKVCDNVTIPNSIDHYGTFIICSGGSTVFENGIRQYHPCDNITAIHSSNSSTTPHNDSIVDDCAARLDKNCAYGEENSTYSCCAEGTPTALYFHLKNGTQLSRGIPNRITRGCDVDSIPNSIEYDGTVVVTCFSGRTEEDMCNRTLIHHNCGSSSGQPTNAPTNPTWRKSSGQPTNAPTNPTWTKSSEDIGAAVVKTGQISDPFSTQVPFQPKSLLIGIIVGVGAAVVFLVTIVLIIIRRLCINTSHPQSITSTSTNISTHSSPSTTSSSQVECKQESIVTKKDEGAQVVASVCGRSQPTMQYNRRLDIEEDEQHLQPTILPHKELVETVLTEELQFHEDHSSLNQDKDPSSLIQEKDPSSLDQDKEPSSLDQDKDPLSLDQSKDPSSLDQDKEPSSLNQGINLSSLNQEDCAIEMEMIDHEPCSPLPELETGTKRFILDQDTVYESEMKDSPNQDDSGQEGEWSNESVNSGRQESSSPSPVLRRTDSHPMEEEYKDTEDGNIVHVTQNRVYRRLPINVDCLEHTSINVDCLEHTTV